MFVEWGKIAPTKTMLAPIGVRKPGSAIVVPENEISNSRFYNSLRMPRGAIRKTFSSKKEKFGGSGGPIRDPGDL